MINTQEHKNVITIVLQDGSVLEETEMDTLDRSQLQVINEKLLDNQFQDTIKEFYVYNKDTRVKIYIINNNTKTTPFTSFYKIAKKPIKIKRAYRIFCADILEGKQKDPLLFLVVETEYNGQIINYWFDDVNNYCYMNPDIV